MTVQHKLARHKRQSNGEKDACSSRGEFASRHSPRQAADHRPDEKDQRRAGRTAGQARQPFAQDIFVAGEKEHRQEMAVPPMLVCRTRARQKQDAGNPDHCLNAHAQQTL